MIDALISNYDRYNLLNSAILEVIDMNRFLSVSLLFPSLQMFEFIKIEDIKSLCTHVVENFATTLDKITYVQVISRFLEYESLLVYLNLT